MRYDVQLGRGRYLVDIFSTAYEKEQNGFGGIWEYLEKNPRPKNTLFEI